MEFKISLDGYKNTIDQQKKGSGLIQESIIFERFFQIKKEGNGLIHAYVQNFHTNFSGLYNKSAKEA